MVLMILASALLAVSVPDLIRKRTIMPKPYALLVFILSVLLITVAYNTPSALF